MCNLIRAIATQNETENLRHISTTIRVSCMIGILILVQVILQIRVYAIYNASRAILWTNAAFFVLEWSATLSLYAVFARRIEHFPARIECGLCDYYPRQLGACYIPSLVYESYLCALVLRKSFYIKHLTYDNSNSDDVVGVFIRDSILYFFLVSSGLALSMIMFFVAPEFSQWTDSFLDVFGVIGGTRIVLSLRRAALPTLGEAMELETLSTLRCTVPTRRDSRSAAFGV